MAIQGFGKVGSSAAKCLHGKGFKVVGVADIGGGVFNPRGLDIPALLAHVKNSPHQRLDGFGGGEYMAGAEVANARLLALPVDILAPCALENQITAENAGAVKAKIVVEGANGPTTPEADDILATAGVTVVPDILANAGGVTVSYFEWVQDLQANFWDEEDVNRSLDRLMMRSLHDVYDVAAAREVRPAPRRADSGGQPHRQGRHPSRNLSVRVPTVDGGAGPFPTARKPVHPISSCLEPQMNTNERE